MTLLRRDFLKSRHPSWSVFKRCENVFKNSKGLKILTENGFEMDDRDIPPERGSGNEKKVICRGDLKFSGGGAKGVKGSEI